MSEWMNATVVPGRGPGAMLFMGHGDPNTADGFTWQSWEILSVPERLAEDGPVVRDLGRQWVVMVASQWNDVYRRRFAAASGVDLNEVKDAGMADINRIRNDIVHHDGIATARNCGRCELFTWFAPGEEIRPDMAHVAAFMNYMGLVHGADSIDTSQPWQPFGSSPQAQASPLDPEQPTSAAPEVVELPELGDEELERLFDICRFLLSFLDDGVWKPVSRLEQLLVRTVARGRATYEAILDLAAEGRTRQAAMLGGSLFEDMIVAHWLVLNENDPDWVVGRFDDHARRIRALRGREVAASHGVNIDHVDEGIDHAEPKALDLGQGLWDWWGRDENGDPLTMRELVRRLADEPRFQPRLRGEEPALEQYFLMQRDIGIQAFRHTVDGMDTVEDPSGRFPKSVGRTAPFLVLFGNYWTFGQLIFAALEHARLEDALEHFEKLFVSGLAVFMATVGLWAPWMDEVASWTDESPH
jgi:hypothetical protein